MMRRASYASVGGLNHYSNAKLLLNRQLHPNLTPLKLRSYSNNLITTHLPNGISGRKSPFRCCIKCLYHVLKSKPILMAPSVISRAWMQLLLQLQLQWQHSRTVECIAA